MNQSNRSAGKGNLGNIDPIFLFVVIALPIAGLMLIYSAGIAQENSTHFDKQLIFLIIGIIILGMISFISPKVLHELAYIVYALSIGLMLVVLISGEIGFGAKRWLEIGGLRIQPSEPAKIALIMAVSRLIADWRSEFSWNLIGRVALLVFPLFILTMLQPDLGTSTTFIVIGALMLAWCGLPLKYFVYAILPFISLFFTLLPWVVVPILIYGIMYIKRKGEESIVLILLIILCLTAIISAPVAWNQLAPYQKKRLTTFLNPNEDPLGAGYQVIQSKVAIGSGGLKGMGYLQGTQTQLKFLPQQHTDFIFSLASEEFGFIGSSTILFLYFIYMWRSISLAARTKNQFMSNVAFGSAVLVFYHCIVNIGMAMGNLPVTGLPLPFLSYGGSFLISCMICSGLVLSTGIHRRQY